LFPQLLQNCASAGRTVPHFEQVLLPEETGALLGNAHPQEEQKPAPGLNSFLQLGHL